ncbi:hypothetical protein SLEP1_g27629 [Rubroshorea leprosula]|uniref:Uncharacterized protein n=1 Tax=Rubroshorea leprosula TaxID=152421 RepID=A0AAV5JR09_9ROSI|nr:hypothetical protein SLEP1_g27629 [Rubroshorea leprosula]
MSSEETLSIGGGEGEQELSLTSKSEVESSRSERSGGVEGEMEEVGIPSNVLEVDPDRAKFYNEGEEVVSEVVGYESMWRRRSDLSHLVEQYAIQGHVLLRSAEERERACSAPRDHWMPVYRHYLTAGLRFPVPELLVALLVEYGLGLTQLVPNAVRLVVGWKRKKSNPNQYSLSSGKQEEVKRLEKRGEDLMDIMHFISPAMLKAAEVYGPNSICKEEMNRLMSRGKTATLPEKRLKAPVAPSVGERVPGKTSRSRPNESTRAEVGLARIRGGRGLRKLQPRIGGGLRRCMGVVTHGKEKESPIPRQKSSFYEGTSKTIAKRFIKSTFPETVNLINAVLNCLKERNNLVDKYDELNLQKQSVEQNFNDLTLELEKVREELAFAKVATKAEVEKRKRAEEELAKARGELAEVQKKTELEVHNSVRQHVSNFINSVTFSKIVDLFRMLRLVMAFNDCRKKAGVEEDGESRTAELRPDITLNWERDKAGRTVLPPRLKYEFVAVDEDEIEALATT